MTTTAATVLPGESVLLFSRQDVRRLLGMAECIAAVEDAFRLFGEGSVQPPAVLGTHVAGGGFHIKAGVMPFAGRLYYAAKANANFPGNPAHGLPTIQGVVLLFDAECGRPLAIMDSAEITALRTGAATAVAARRLARADSSVLTIIGCGTQAPAQAAALAAVLPIRRLFAFDLDSTRARDFAARIADELRIEAAAATDLAAATNQADVIVTCTTSREPFLKSEDVRPGTFIAAVGADNEDKQELDSRLLADHRVVPDVAEQAAAIGELHHALRARLLAPGQVAGALGDIVAGRQPGRTSPQEIIIFDSTGMALQDVAAAAAIYQRAEAGDRIARIALTS